MTVSCSIVLLQGAEAEEDRPLPGSLPAELPNGRVPTLESSKGWGRLELPKKIKPLPKQPPMVGSPVCATLCTCCNVIWQVAKLQDGRCEAREQSPCSSALGRATLSARVMGICASYNDDSAV